MEEADLDVAEQAFAAGLLHDLGKLLLAANLPEAFRQAIALAREQGRPVWEAESQVLGVCHAELGACLLGIWGLPAPIVEAVALHHFPLRCPKRVFSPLTAVHASDFITRQSEPCSTLIEAELDSDYLAGLKLSDHVEAWQLQDSLEQV
jgi:HD-like signal output (HDOD) protein